MVEIGTGAPSRTAISLFSQGKLWQPGKIALCDSNRLRGGVETAFATRQPHSSPVVLSGTGLAKLKTYPRQFFHAMLSPQPYEVTP